ncbi:MAG: OB-fold nucleic acid binding domain-containing protein [Marinifilaceae bacterium]
MTRQILTSILLAILLIGCNSSNKVKVADLYNTGKNYVEQEVLVEGTVMHICKHGGKKMFIAGKDLNKLVQIVPTGSIEKFNENLEGEDIAITGIVRKLVIEEKNHGDGEHQHGQGEKKHCDTESKTGSACQKEFYYVECSNYEVKN